MGKFLGILFLIMLVVPLHLQRMSKFPDKKKERSRELDRTYDAINKKFSAATIQRGSNLQPDLHVGKKYQVQMEEKDKMILLEGSFYNRLLSIPNMWSNHKKATGS